MNFNWMVILLLIPKRECWNNFLVGCSYREDQYSRSTSGVYNYGQPGITSILSLLCFVSRFRYFYVCVELGTPGRYSAANDSALPEGFKGLACSFFWFLSWSSTSAGTCSTLILRLTFPSHMHDISKGSGGWKQPASKIWHK